MITTDRNIVVDNKLGPPLAIYCVTLIDGTKMYGQEYLETSWGFCIIDQGRKIMIPFKRINYMESIKDDRNK